MDNPFCRAGLPSKPSEITGRELYLKDPGGAQYGESFAGKGEDSRCHDALVAVAMHDGNHP
jgi:hypothetical protein